MAADADAPLYTMKLLPRAPPLEPFDETRDLLDLNEPALPPARPRADVVPPDAAQLAELLKLRTKLDDGLALCLNLHGERTRLEADLDTKRAEFAARDDRGDDAPAEDAGVAAFERAFDESARAGGLTLVQKAVFVGAAFLLGFVADRIPDLVYDFLDADADDGAGPRVEADFYD